MTGHSRPEDLLSAYLDGECTPAERTAVEARIASDREWRAAFEDVQFARDAVRALPRREPPPGFLESPVAPEDELAPRRHARMAGAGLVAAAAVAVAFFAAAPAGQGGGREITPPIARLTQTHGATSSLGGEPVSSLAPVAVAVEFAP